MGVTDRYRGPSDLPRAIPVFPLTGCILLPRSSLPLNIFEPRYLAMVNDAISDSRIIGIIQPQSPGGAQESPSGKAYSLRQTGCAGRITSFTETDDGRMLVTLTGIARFDVVSERQTTKPYRICEVSAEAYKEDFIPGHGQDLVDWDKFLTILKSYLEARKLVADWQSIQKSPAEMLINTLAMISPYGAEEKQALLEAADLKARSEVLMALAEMDMAAPDNGGGSMH
ncbi:MAG: LON peptidase substrate-binding domain-containing protein [Hyphomicrobiales bacterium]|nr:LON peptidase substrate-binding domain-containing protein [Hyphomicrobiales bacterium]